jgi:putative nucleotidyltransferase with HDIG domain
MSIALKLEDQEVLAETYVRASAPLGDRERVAEGLVASAFAAAAVAIWLVRAPGSFELVPALLCMVVMVLATRVRFDTPFGFTVATQLAFVPLVFALPAALVAPAVTICLVLAGLPEVHSGKVPPQRLVLTLGNAWFAIGPAAVFAIAGTAPRSAGPLLLIAALLAQFTVDFGVSSARFWLDRTASLAMQLRETWVYGIDAALSGIALAVAEEIHAAPVAALAPLPLLAVLAIFARERHHRLESLLELSNSYRGTALVLGEMLEADDGYTGEHSRGVVRLATSLAGKLGLTAEQRRNVEFAALLHDVGKVTVPNDIINKPGPLTPEEWEVIHAHTIVGERMLTRIGGFMTDVGQIVRSHHERWDGTGYPDGLAGDAIPLEARVISCCDSWNAMRTDRAYRGALPFQTACEELRANAGQQFDPAIVAAFLDLLETGDHDPDQLLLDDPVSWTREAL